MVCDSVDWSKSIVFGAISDWQLPSLIKICSKQSSIRYCVDCPLYQRPDSNIPEMEEKAEESAAVVKPLEKRLVCEELRKAGKSGEPQISLSRKTCPLCLCNNLCYRWSGFLIYPILGCIHYQVPKRPENGATLPPTKAVFPKRTIRRHFSFATALAYYLS